MPINFLKKIFMRKLLLSILFVGSFSANAQTTIFEDSFETYADFVINNFGAWNGIDTDLRTTYTGGVPAPGTSDWDNAGAPQAFQIFNPTIAGVANVATAVAPDNEVRNFDPRTGSKFAACWAAVPLAPVTANNDWLISPPITLGSSGNVMSVWVKSMSSTYGLERYRIGIFVGSTIPTAAQFVYLAGSPVALTAPYTSGWEERVIGETALNTYNGQTVRFGIQCVSADAYMFMVDDFKVTTTGLNNAEFSASKFAMYPNPANDVVSISNTENILISGVTITDLNGRTVSSTQVSNVTEVQINVASLNAGVYFMNIASDTGDVVKKFIKN